MRLSTYLKISVLTGAVMTPAMAQDAETAQQEALKRLREFTVSEVSATRSTVPPASIGPINASQQPGAAVNVAYPGAPVSADAMEQARQRLRSSDGSSAGSATLQNPGLQVRPSMERSRQTEAAVSQSRNDRELRLQQQAQQAEIARQQKLSEKRRTWEIDIAERERLRQRQRDFDESVAKEMGGRSVTASQAFSNQSNTLNTSRAANRAASASVIGIESDKHGTFEPEYIQQLQARAKRLAAETSSAQADVSATTTSPSVTPTPEASGAATTASSSPAAGADEAAIEARALEIVRQNQAAAPAPTATQTAPPAQIAASSAPFTEATPNAETIRRAQELLRSQQGTGTQAAPAPVSRDSQTRGMEVLRQQAERSAAPTTSTTVRPTLDPATQKIIEKQDRQIGTALSGTSSATASKTIGVETPATNVSTDELEAQAKETLRRQQEAAAASSATAAQPGASAATSDATPATSVKASPATTPPGATPANGTVTIAPGNEGTFSPEVEARARQILRERAATIGEGADTPTAPATTPSNATTVTPAPAGFTTNTPAQTAPETADAQAQALKVLRSQQPASTANGSVTAPKTNGSSTSTTSRRNNSKTTPTSAGATNPAPAIAETSPRPQGLRSKQQRLADLTQAYIADKMTPAEYHAERAKILAEPESK